MKDRNENRPGYKKTKIGWIPIDWKTPLLDTISRRETGHTPNKKKPEFWNGPIKWVSLADSGKLNRPVIDHTAKTITKEGIRNSSARLLQSGTVILLRDASVGLSSILIEEMAVSQHFVTWSCGDTLHNVFLYYWLLYNKRHFQKMAFGSTIVTIGMPFFKKMRVPIPPLPEQQKIGEILSTWDEAIEQMRKLIDAKKRRKKALMQQMLTGKSRLPEFVTFKGRKSYRFFDLPEDWESPQIRDVAQEYSKRNTDGNDLTVLACSKHLGFVKSSEYFGKRVFSADTSNYKIIRRNYFGYPSNHIEEGSIGLLLSHDIGIVSPIYTVFQCNDRVIPEYLYAVFKTDTFRHIFAISTNASVDRRGSLRWREFSLIRVPRPSIKEQQAIVDVLNAADIEINQLDAKLKALEKQKRGLMQKLLTGEVRVKL